jgi:nucleoside-diphosphate kinase
MERSLILLKPGVLQRRLVGKVLARFEEKGLNIIALKMIQMSKEMVEAHYQEHQGKDFYQKLVDYTLSGPVIAAVIEGNEAISVIRKLAGPTSLKDSQPGTIRGDFAAQTRLNIVHASDSPESAAREINLFFKSEELCVWEDGNAQWF